MKKIGIIGSGFAGLSAASYLAKEGYEVHIFEKNNELGGRARLLTTNNGYSFDMGPSWYWMPEVFENYFKDFNYDISSLYILKKLNPAFEMIFSNQQKIKIPESFEELIILFESVEVGSGIQLQRFLNNAEKKYIIAFQHLLNKPGLSWLEFAEKSIILNSFKLTIFTSFSNYVKRYFKHPFLIALMEFPILFLGAMPQQTPALYSLMNYAGLKLGTFYPIGGFNKVIESMVLVNKNLGVQIHTNAAVQKINILKNKINTITINNKEIHVDGVIASADYHHIEHNLLDKQYRNYSTKYWENRVFAPSCLIFYLGINKKINNINHHTLFFENSLYAHGLEIYKTKKWPQKPLFYVCCTSKTDPSVAPIGHENIFMLMPIAVWLEDTTDIREFYFNEMINRLENHIQEPIRNNIDYNKSFCIKDFMLDYNAFKGNGYGLANTLNQTAVLKPSMQNKKIKNMFYAGQLTVPGPGVPPAIISGKIAAGLLNKYFKK
ncbi:MAG: phytoene desaturase family protein [Sediminibacterium sp.]|nr:phytoene desaturase family protein [Sediminibacterium sp.]